MRYFYIVYYAANGDRTAKGYRGIINELGQVPSLAWMRGEIAKDIRMDKCDVIIENIQEFNRKDYFDLIAE